MSKRAFTLIELMVVVALIMVLCSMGFMNYISFRDRQKVENTAKQIITHLRNIQTYARVGARGTGSCNPSDIAQQVADGNYRLSRWETGISSEKLTSRAHCSPPESQSDDVTYYLPTDISLSFLHPDGSDLNKITFESVFGRIYLNDDPTLNNAKFIVYNETTAYQFSLDNGNLTVGCFCPTRDNCDNICQ
jgi:prepilin-type N-terminal cleavage/methylation domain-containing protein